MPHFTSRALTAVSGAAALVLAASAMAMPAAAAEQAEAAIDFSRLAYEIEMRAGGIESFAEIPREVPQDFGYSYVLMEKTGQFEPFCTTESGGFYLGEEVEDGVLKGGAAPVGEGQSAQDASGYENPTLSRRVQPQTGAGEFESSNAVDPALPADGNGLLSKSECTEDALGATSRGDVINAAGFRVIGSNIVTKVDKATGTYVGTGRAYVNGLDGAYDSMASMMTVTYVPGTDTAPNMPVVDFRLTFFNSDAGSSGFTSDGFTFGGSQIPADEFVKTFNDQADAFAAMAEPVGPAGVSFLAPKVFKDADSGQFKITAPAAAGNLGFNNQAGNVGQNSGLRFGSITFTGDNVIIG